MGALSLAEVRERLEDVVESLARGETVEIARDHGPALRVAAEASPRMAFDPDEIDRIRALSKPWDGQGSFVVWAKERDLL